MNKQEAVELLESQKITMPLNEKDKKFNTATDNAITVIKEIDSDKMPVLSKKEAEWVDNLTNYFSLSDALYYINRCGYGFLLSFEIGGHIHELPVDDVMSYGEMCKLKERLTNAVLYDYEVAPEKRYTVELPNPNSSGYKKIYLAKNKDGKVEFFTWSGYTSIEFADNWKQEENAQLTEEEIKEDFAYLWEANLAEEVEE